MVWRTFTRTETSRMKSRKEPQVTMAPATAAADSPMIFSSQDASMASLSVMSPTGLVVAIEWSADTIRSELRQAVAILSHRCLKLSARWASEQLIGLPPSSSSSNVGNPLSTPQTATDVELYAKSLLELGEYAHAAAVLSKPNQDVTAMTPPVPGLSSFGIYLRAYAMYLAGERRKEEEMVELREPLQHTKLQNVYLKQLNQELRDAYKDGLLDAFGLYVYGLVLKESPTQSSPHSAHDIFIESLLLFPWNWSAWLDLASLCIADPNFHPIVEKALQTLHSHYMYCFFCAHVLLENQAHENALFVLEKLLQPDSNVLFQTSYVASKMAVAHYHLREFEVSQECFVSLLEKDPYRLEDMDVYSNILYVQEDSVALSQLAHTAVKVDKYCPESCCIVGNYYSLKSQRQKAIQYFQRALKLNRNYTCAWTLMGHEYVELKNTAAAMEAYRMAVDVNQKDYRAWYGLGQTYEFLNMQLYALFYYRKAASLRPYDPRMWCAMGSCYMSLGRKADAIKSYERAVSHQDLEGIATIKLASLYRQEGQTEKAAQCFMRHLELRYLATATATSTPTDVKLETILNGVVVHASEAEALLFLANYHRNHGEYETAAICCSRLLEYPGPEKEEGKALLREIRSRRERLGPAPESPRRKRRDDD